MSENDENTIKVGDATYSFGGPCPPIQSIFFPIEEEKEKEGEDKDDSAQSS